MAAIERDNPSLKGVKTADILEHRLR